ncbi:hypothetical protein, partial [Rubrivirga sp.]|uniref:hypothetical protein n=1 Tax=Rubrivirga sp. TaxID=1885344 RepID=UPI003C730BFB
TELRRARSSSASVWPEPLAPRAGLAERVRQWRNPERRGRRAPREDREPSRPPSSTPSFNTP